MVGVALDSRKNLFAESGVGRGTVSVNTQRNFGSANESCETVNVRKPVIPWLVFQIFSFLAESR